MKLHLPKILLTSVIAAVCCVQQVSGADRTITGNDADLDDLSANDTLTINLTNKHLEIGAHIIPAKVIIESMVLNNGYSDGTYIFQDNTISGEGNFSFTHGSPARIGFIFDGSDMSKYSGNMSINSNNSHYFVFRGTTTGTGSITVSGTSNYINVIGSTILNSSITASNLNIKAEGANTTTTIGRLADAEAGLSAIVTTVTASNLTIDSGAALKLVNGTLEVSSTIYNTGSLTFGSNGALIIDSYDNLEQGFSSSWKSQETNTIVNENTCYLVVKGSGATNISTAHIAGKDETVVNGEIATQQQKALYVAATDTSLSNIQSLEGSSELYGIAIKSGATVTNDNATAFTNGIYLTGDGTYNLGAVNKAGENAKFTKGELLSGTWAGTVSLYGGEKKTGDNNSQCVQNINFNNLGQTGSTVEIAEPGLYGYFGNGTTFNPNIKLTGNLVLQNGNKDQKFTFAGTISGNGSFIIKRTGGDNQSYTFANDISQWKGKLEMDSNLTSNVIFTDGAKEINADIVRTNGTLNVTVNNSGTTTTFKKGVSASSVTATANSGISLVGNMTTGSFTLDNGSTLDFAGGSLTVTNSITLSTVTVSDFSKYFKADNLTTVLVTAGGIEGWNGALTGSYSVDGKAYTTTIDQSGNSIVLSFEADPVEQISLDVTEAVLGESVLALTIAGDLAGMSNVDLLLSAPLLEAIDGKSGLVSLMLTDATGAEYSTVGENPISVTFGGGTYVGEKNEAGEATGMYRVEYIPEPTTATLSLLALCGLAARRRRR